jgi:hypothetical protein
MTDPILEPGDELLLLSFSLGILGGVVALCAVVLAVF